MNHPCPTKSHRTCGFTLMEVLVALFIMATSLTMLMQLFSGGIRLRHTAKDYTQAVWHANARMETLLLSDPLEPGISSGKIDDRYKWHGQIKEIVLSENLEENESAAKAYHVTLKIGWKSGQKDKEVVLDTVTLARAEK